MKPVDIKLTRKKLGLTQKDFAERVGVSHRTVQTWESGERNISQSTALLIKDIESKLIKSAQVSYSKETDVKPIFYDKDGKGLSMEVTCIKISNNFSRLMEYEAFNNLILMESLKKILKAKQGDKFNVDLLK